MKKPKKVTAESAIKAYKEADYKIRIDALNKKVKEEREKQKGYDELIKVYSSYIAILLKQMGADENNAVTISNDMVKSAMGGLQVRATVTENGEFKLFYEEAKG